VNPKEFLAAWWAKHGDEIFQFMVGKVNVANARADAAEAEAAALRELLAEYGTGEWDDSDFDKWIDKKDKLLKALSAAPEPQR
jgi:hypothetical protein